MASVANTYAQALYSLAKEERLEDRILSQMKTLQVSFAQEPDFLRLLAAHNVSKQERCQILDDSFRGSVEPYLLNFLKILTEKGYIRHFFQCCQAFEGQYNEDHGILSVKAVTATALTPEQANRLKRKLEKLTGKTVALTQCLDPEVLGGMRLDYDGKRVDGTVKSRLDSIAGLLKNTVL